MKVYSGTRLVCGLDLTPTYEQQLCTLPFYERLSASYVSQQQHGLSKVKQYSPCSVYYAQTTLCSIDAALCDYTKKKVPMLLLATFYDYLKEGHYDRSICPFQNRFCQELEVWIESCQLSTRLSKYLSKGSPQKVYIQFGV